MVTIKNAQVLDVLMALNQLVAKDFHVKTSLKIRTIRKELSAKWEIVDEVRKSLIEKYAQRDAEGKTVPGEPINGQETIAIVESEKAAFQAAWDELLDQPVEISLSLSADDFGDVTISPMLVESLGDILA